MRLESTSKLYTLTSTLLLVLFSVSRDLDRDVVYFCGGIECLRRRPVDDEADGYFWGSTPWKHGPDCGSMCKNRVKRSVARPLGRSLKRKPPPERTRSPALTKLKNAHV